MDRISRFDKVKTYLTNIIIQEDLLKINKNMLKLIQLFTSAWRNKDTDKKGKKRKIRQAVVYTTFTKPFTIQGVTIIIVESLTGIV